MVWRGGASSVNLFVRGGVSPSDRNLVSYYIDGGAGIKGPLPGRPDDTLTFGVAYAKISRDAVALDRDNLAHRRAALRGARRRNRVRGELRGADRALVDVQPDVQYIVHPSGGQNPDDPTQAIGHAFLAGIRSTIKF